MKARGLQTIQSIPLYLAHNRVSPTIETTQNASRSRIEKVLLSIESIAYNGKDPHVHVREHIMRALH